MTTQEIAEKEQQAFKWLKDKGYNRKVSKDIAPILVDYLKEQFYLYSVGKSEAEQFFCPKESCRGDKYRCKEKCDKC